MARRPIPLLRRGPFRPRRAARLRGALPGVALARLAGGRSTRPEANSLRLLPSGSDRFGDCFARTDLPRGVYQDSPTSTQVLTGDETEAKSARGRTIVSDMTIPDPYSKLGVRVRINA